LWYSPVIEVFSTLKEENAMLQKEKNKLENQFTRLNPLNDYLFKQYMGTDECKICLQSFLSAVLETEITDVEIVENKELTSDTIDGKFGRLDVRATILDGTQINIEVQLCNEGNMVERTLFYNSRLCVDSLKRGDDYIELKKVITINILNFNYFPYDEFHISSHHRIDQHPEKLLTEKSEIHFIELKKFYKNTKFDINNSLHRWIKYFDQNIDEYELKELVVMDYLTATAEDKAKEIAVNEKESLYYEALEDAQRNRISDIDCAKRQGIEEGKVVGRAEGVEQEGVRYSILIEQLFKDNRQDELIPIAQDTKLRQRFYQEYKIVTATAEADIEKELRYYEALADARRNRISALNYARRQGIEKGRHQAFEESKLKGAEQEAIRYSTLATLLLKDNRLDELIQVGKDTNLRKDYYKRFNIT